MAVVSGCYREQGKLGELGFGVFRLMISAILEGGDFKVRWLKVVVVVVSRPYVREERERERSFFFFFLCLGFE